ncbi:transposase [Salmonella enterica]|uniref:Transposase n=2 Tax=Salmonella enterica TaxID=28901 RepID=A0A5V1J1E6_SALER|nr:IS66 family insertion sequence hypothetical protein [Salmonella enterica]EDX4412455.1 transposase [Salmonella enterica subsp. houtenae serovar 44:z36,[z38]:-]HAC6491654.1 IS66 family insertion sequence hypothetical protein [Salmonella enterica subsp. houtenae serovar 44:z36[z38]:-]EAY1800138.1 hypothetical protein [Salmonella enterica]EAY1903961.1 hypothetical protein [Salmonella enterica]
MEFKLAMVEKSLQPDVSVALLARNNGINDNLLFPVSAPYRDFCRAARDSPVIIEDKVVPVVVEHSPALLPATSPPPAIPPKPGQVCEVAIGRARLKLSGNLMPAMLATLVRELKKRRR